MHERKGKKEAGMIQEKKQQWLLLHCCFFVTTQHPMGMSNRLTVVLQQELH